MVMISVSLVSINFPVQNSVQGADRSGILDKFQTHLLCTVGILKEFLKQAALAFDTTNCPDGSVTADQVQYPSAY